MAKDSYKEAIDKAQRIIESKSIEFFEGLKKVAIFTSFVDMSMDKKNTEKLYDLSEKCLICGSKLKFSEKIRAEIKEAKNNNKSIILCCKNCSERIQFGPSTDSVH